MDYTYTYSIINDVISGKVEPSSLQQEIANSEIVISIRHITIESDNLFIAFKAELSDDDKILLDDIVHYHSGEIIAEGEVYDNVGKQIIHQTSKPLGFTTYWTGAGDSNLNVYDCGHGAHFMHKHIIGDPITKIEYVDFNCITNRTFLHEGYLVWKGGLGDEVSLEVVSSTVSGTISNNTNYNVYNDYLVVPANKDGYFQLDSDITNPYGGLVYMPFDEDGTRPKSFWNAEWDAVNKRFINITPAPLGDGKYNMFTKEVVFNRFINRLHLLGDGSLRLQCSDSEEFGQGMRLKATYETATDLGDPDHDWYCTFYIVMHREKTV